MNIFNADFLFLYPAIKTFADGMVNDELMFVKKAMISGYKYHGKSSFIGFVSDIIINIYRDQIILAIKAFIEFEIFATASGKNGFHVPFSFFDNFT